MPTSRIPAARRGFWLRVTIFALATALVIVVWTVPTDTTFDGSITTTGLLLDYYNSTDRFLSATSNRLSVESFRSIHLAPGVLVSNAGGAHHTFAAGLKLSAAVDDAEWLVEEQTVRIVELQLPQNASVSLTAVPVARPDGQLTRTLTRLTARLGPPGHARSPGIGADDRCGLLRSTAAAQFGSTVSFSRNTPLRFRCAGCRIEGTAPNANVHDVMEFRFDETATPIGVIEGERGGLQLRMDLADGPLDRDSQPVVTACNLRFEDEVAAPGQRAQSTVVGGQFFSSALSNTALGQVRAHARVSVRSSNPIEIVGLEAERGHMKASLSGTAQQLTINDVVIKRSLIDDIMTSRLYAVINLGLVFALFVLKILETVKVDTVLTGPEKTNE